MTDKKEFIKLSKYFKDTIGYEFTDKAYIDGFHWVDWEGSQVDKEMELLIKKLYSYFQSKQQEKIERVKKLIKGRQLWLEDGSLAPDFGVIPELRNYNQAILDVLSILKEE